MTRRRLVLAVLVVVAALALLAASCGGRSTDTTVTTDQPVSLGGTRAPQSTEAPEATTSSSSSTTTATTLADLGPVSALNGLPGAPARLERRALAVKIDNHANARPQSGLQDADAVIEIRVEGGISRFIALFHDNESDYIGPIRSGRPTDAAVLRPLGVPFLISGAQPWVKDLIRDAGVRFIEEGPATFRISERSAPHNLYSKTDVYRRLIDNFGWADDPPPGLYDLGDPGPPDGAATVITFEWSSGNTVTWEWDGERYQRSINGEPHLWRDRSGEEGNVAADVLVVVTGRLYTAPAPAGGSDVPATETTGTGRALVFWGGGVVEGTWERATVADRFTLTRSDGTPLPVPPGTPWISVFPDDQPITWE